MQCRTGPAIGIFVIYLGLVAPAIALMLLAVFPTDTKTIRVTNYFLVFFLTLMTLNFINASEIVRFRGFRQDYIYSHVCYGLVAIVFLAAVVYASRGLALDCCCEGGGCALPPRLALSRIWITWRVSMFAVGSCLGFLALAETNANFMTAMVSSSMIMSLEFWTPLLFMTRRNRGRIHRWLMGLWTSSKGTAEQEAATIAALLGGGSADAALAGGAARFRALPLSELTEEDLSGSADSGLHVKTRPAALGDVDGFVSHSWSDNGVAKYKVLQEWSRSRSKQGSATVWLDKACIDQSSIAADLQALPVFLSGCKELLVVAGSTYSKRLWCVVEVFVFLKTGGSQERMFIADLGGDSVRGMLDQFDALEAKCFLKRDRERLLAVIESGYGDCVKFNRKVRGIFAARSAQDVVRV